MDLKNFSQKAISEITDNVKKTVVENVEKITEEFKQKEPEHFENINEAYDKYSSMPEGDLIDELIKITKAQKAAGTFDEEQLKITYNALYPMLNEQQRVKLDQLIKLIS
jgi:uncharacterized protein YjgD (DUF1641 family)